MFVRFAHRQRRQSAAPRPAASIPVVAVPEAHQEHPGPPDTPPLGRKARRRSSADRRQTGAPTWSTPEDPAEAGDSISGPRFRALGHKAEVVVVVWSDCIIMGAKECSVQSTVFRCALQMLRDPADPSSVPRTVSCGPWALCGGTQIRRVFYIAYRHTREHPSILRPQDHPPPVCRAWIQPFFFSSVVF